MKVLAKVSIVIIFVAGYSFLALGVNSLVEMARDSVEIDNCRYDSILSHYNKYPHLRPLIDECIKDGKISKPESNEIASRLMDYFNKEANRKVKASLVARIAVEKVVKDIPTTQPN